MAGRSLSLTMFCRPLFHFTQVHWTILGLALVMMEVFELLLCGMALPVMFVIICVNMQLQPPKCLVVAGALELANVPKMRPRTKHINIRYHHFRSFTEGPNPKITVHAVDTENQLADVFTKAVRLDLFKKFRKAIMGW